MEHEIDVVAWNDEKLIMVEAKFQEEGFSEALVPVFAKRGRSGIEAKGSEKHFLWLEQKIEAGKRGGVESARVRKEKGSAQPQNSPKRIEAKPSGVEPSYSSSSSNKKEKRESGRASQSETHTPLAQIWNSECGNLLPKVMGCSPGGRRFKAAERAWKEKPDSEYWRTVMRKIRESDFCIGKNERGWRATFDFLIRPDTHVKALEGNYDNAQKTVAPHDPYIDAINNLPSQEMFSCSPQATQTPNEK